MKQHDNSNNNGYLSKAPKLSIGASDSVLVIISLIGFFSLALIIFFIILTKVKTARELREEAEKHDTSYDERLAQADVSTLSRSQRRARARYIMKQQRRANHNIVHPIEEDGDEHQQQQQNLLLEQQHHDEDIPPFQEDSHHATIHNTLSRKERQKAAKQIELQERKMYEQKRRKEQQETLNAAKSKKREKERMVAIQAERDRKERQEQRQANELAKYCAWKTLFVENTESITVQEWIHEMKQNRIVKLQDLAIRFGVSQDRIRERIENLITSFRISGILLEPDDKNEQNRFIYLSSEDMIRLALFVKAQAKITSKEFSLHIQNEFQFLSSKQ